MESTNALPRNYRLDEYVVQNVLGHGGFGITYLARDMRLGALVAVKEYFPRAYAVREQTHTIHPNTQDAANTENYRWGLQEFLKEARALAQFKHPHIVRVLRFLEANGTAYVVMEYEEGESLSSHLAHHGGFLNEPALLNIFLPVLSGLQAVHDAGLLHLDIKPDNIYLRRNGPPMIIDFGSARQRSGTHRAQKIALTPGYAALEQYPGHGELGPWSDVYSIGATLYRCITGKEPMDALERERGLKRLHVDPFIPATRFERPLYSAHIRECVDAAATLQADKRPRSAAALQNGLMGKGLQTETPHRISVGNVFSSGQGFLGVFTGQTQRIRRRLIPRGPLEKLLVFGVFLAVLVVAPVRILQSTGHLGEDELHEFVDRSVARVVETGKTARRFLEENILGVTRPPDVAYTPSRRPAPVRPSGDENPAVVPYDTAKNLVATHTLPTPALALAFLQEGKQIAVALDDGSVQLRLAETGALIRTVATGSGSPGALAASPDGRRLAFGGERFAIQIWDMEKNIFLGELAGHEAPVIALAFSPDGKSLASAGRDQTALLWDVDAVRLLRELGKPDNEPLALAFTPDGARLAVADSAGGIRYWQLDTVQEIAYVPTRELPLSAIAYSPDGKWFALGGEQGFLGLWDVSRQRPDRLLSGAPDTTHAVVFSPDSQWLLVAGSDAALQLWHVPRGELALRYEGNNHQTFAVALAPGGRQVAAAGIDGKLTLWR